MILTNLRQLLHKHTENVVKSKGKDLSIPPFDLSAPPPKVAGDLAANVTLMIAKQLGESPRKLAEEIIRTFPSNDLTRKIEIAGPGFLNFWLREEALCEELEMLATGKRESFKDMAAQKILIEFVSANPTGPLHVGHGRGAALGDSLVRLFRYLGHSVTAEFYVNDAGGQVRNLGLSVEARIKELKGEKFEFPTDGYKGAYVIDIAKEALADGKALTPVLPAQMVFTGSDMAGYASERILKDIQMTLEDFGVHFDHWYRESSLHEEGRVQKLIEELKKKDAVYEQEGAVWFRATNFGDEKDRVLQKTNEAPTYFASDIAYHADKLSRGYDQLINIWGADHHGYAQRLKGAVKAMGQDPSRIEIIFNQMVSIMGGRLSKRAGDIVTLKELVQEVGKDATRFFFALRSPGSHFEFDLDLAKKQAPDNPVYYVQYVHARCCSIFREAEKRGFSTDPSAWKKAGFTPSLHEAERTMLLHLMGFDRTVQLCAKDYSNHHLTVYLLELAGKFHSFYEQCPVLDSEPSVRSFRLGLIEAIRRRVAQGLDLLGVSAPDKL